MADLVGRLNAAAEWYDERARKWVSNDPAGARDRATAALLRAPFILGAVTEGLNYAGDDQEAIAVIYDYYLPAFVLADAVLGPVTTEKEKP